MYFWIVIASKSHLLFDMGMHVWYHFSHYGYKVKILSFRSNIDYKGKWGLLLREKDFAKFEGTRALGRLCPFTLGLLGCKVPGFPAVCALPGSWVRLRDFWLSQSEWCKTACPPLQYSLISRANTDEMTVVEKSELDYLQILRCHLKFFSIFGESLDWNVCCFLQAEWLWC